ncbi:T9SS sorting signal type C domain-containing protein [Flavobacterium wongokense]|uniref:Ig-like domain-containing protein n=1 Tax=Flavobacterium wongokense TaxID=2910674 RepID=UPI00351D13E2
MSATAWNGTGSVFVPSTGTVNFGAAGNQTIAANSSFYNLGFSGSGIKTLSNATTINNNLSISGTAVANLGTGLTHSALSLTLGGASQVIGTWGSTASPAVNKNATWFGSTATGIININCNAPSAPTSGGNKTICSGATIPALTVTVTAGQVVDWYNQASGGTLLLSGSTSYTPAAAGTYHAQTRVSATGCLSATRTAVVLTINSNPAVPSLTGSTICTSPGGNGTITTTTSQTGVNYQLYNSSNATVQAAKAGTGSALNWTALAAGNGYYVIATNATTGCFSTSTAVNVSANANPTALVLTGSTICASPGDDGTITSSTSQTGVNYQLYNSSNVAIQAVLPGTGSALTWTDLDAGNGYYVVATNATTGCISSNSNAVNVTTTANPAALVITGSTICASPGDNGTITSTTSVAGIEYQLIDDADEEVGDPIIGTGAALSFTNVPAGTGYYVEATNLTTGCASVPSNLVNVSTTPNPANKTITVSSAAVCTGTGANVIVAGSLSTENYQLRNNSGNTNIGSALTGNGGNLNLPTGNLTVATTFNVLATITATGCTTQLTTTPSITVNPTNTAGAASSSPTLCVNTALTAITHTTTGATGIGTASGLPTGVTAAWSSNTITISGTPTATGTFNYSIPLTGGCGNVNATGTINVNSSSVAPTGITGTSTICNGNSTTLTVSGGTLGAGATVQWFTGSCGGTSAGTGTSITVSPTSNTTYYVRYSGTCNTTTCASQLITVNTLSTAPTGITGTSTICNGNSTTLTVSGGAAGTGATVQWFTGSCGGTSAGTGNSITVSPSSNTTYYVRYSGTCNTTTCASQLVTVNTPSVAPTGITGTTTICNGNSTTLTISGGTSGTGASVQWFTGSCGGTSAGTGNSITVSPSTNTTYYVRYSGSCNTTACASQLVTVNTPSVAPTGIAGTTTICNGNSTTLTVSGGTAGTGATAEWFTGSCGGTSAGTGNSITVSPSSNTTYYVRYNGTCNTTACASQLVTVNTPSVAPTGITGTTTICNGNSTTLTVSGGTLGTGATVQWFTGSCGGTSAGTGNSITVSPSSNTTYYVRYSGTCNTTTCASQLVTVNATTSAAILTGSAAICSGSPTNLSVAITGGTSPFTVVYNDGTSNTTVNNYASGSNISVSPLATTTYTLVSVTGASGCVGTGNTGSASITIDLTTSTNGGASWSNGTPTSGKSVVFDGSTATLSGDLAACSLRLKNNATVTVPSGFDVTLNGRLTVEAGSTFTLNNNANLLQNTTLANSGNIIVKRNSSALKRLDYTLWSSPVTGQGVYAYSPSTFGNRFYVYRTNTNVFNNADLGFNLTGLNASGVNGTDSNNVQFAQAKGYLIRMPWDHPTAATIWNGTFTGVPNNGNITFNMINGGAGQRFNLVGNPYPSPISMTQFVSDNSTNITGTLYFWRETNNNTSNNAYCTWAGGTFTSNNEAQVFNPNGILRTGQGFFVEASGAATTVDFRNGQRSSDNADQFFKTGNATAVNDVVETNRFWLNLTNASGAFCQMAAGYMTGATNDVDLYDGKNINTGSALLSSILDNTDYTIQGKALPFNASDMIPLSCKITTAGSYTIAIDHVDGIFTNGAQAVYLKDNLTTTIHNLSTGAYTFASDAGTFTNRFEVVYQAQLSNHTFTANSVVIYSQGNEFVINSGNTIMKSVKVFDIRGRLLFDKTNINSNQATISGGLANEVLLLQITSEDGIVVTKKVIR